MLFLWFYHAARRRSPRYLMVSDHLNYLTFEDPGAVKTARRALELARAGDLYGAAETANVDVSHAAVVSEALRRGMRFSIGIEADNDPRARPDAQSIVDALRPDGIIRSVHFVSIEHPEKGPDWPWPFDNPEFVQFFETVGTERTWELYTAKLFDDLEKLPTHIVGHFYVPATFGHWPSDAVLASYEDRLLEICKRRNLAVEINLRPFYRETSDEQRARLKTAYLRLMRKAKDADVGIAMASDAHSPRDQGACFDLALEMLDACGINELVFPIAGRLARGARRATPEHREKIAARSVTAPPPGSSITGLGRAELGLEDEEEQRPAPRPQRDVGPKKRASSPKRLTPAKSARPAAKPASQRKPKPSSTPKKRAPKAAAKKASPPAKRTQSSSKKATKATGSGTAASAKRPTAKASATKAKAKPKSAKPAKGSAVKSALKPPAKSLSKTAAPKRTTKKAAPKKSTKRTGRKPPKRR
jgi:HisJ family histidinol phosphate phosphatase